MGREIRRVPENWQHPKHEVRRFNCGGYAWELEYRPLYDGDYEAALDEWLVGRAAAADKAQYYQENGDPPQPSDYVHYDNSKATWYQMYETVSEGTPVTPPFATIDELVEYLVEHGDFWDQKRGHGGWSRKDAENFCAVGWAPSMVTFGGAVVEVSGRTEGA